MIKRTRLANTNNLKRILCYLSQDNILKSRANINFNTKIASDVINNAIAFLKSVDLIIEVKEDYDGVKRYQLVKENYIGKLNEEEMNKERISETEANREISNFHKKLLQHVVKVIKLNQESVKLLMEGKTERAKELKEFYLGSISFGNVLVHEMNLEIKKIEREMRK